MLCHSLPAGEFRACSILPHEQRVPLRAPAARQPKSAQRRLENKGCDSAPISETVLQFTVVFLETELIDKTPIVCSRTVQDLFSKSMPTQSIAVRGKSNRTDRDVGDVRKKCELIDKASIVCSRTVQDLFPRACRLNRLLFGVSQTGQIGRRGAFARLCRADSQGIDCMQPDRSGPFPASMPTQSIAVRGKSNRTNRDVGERSQEVRADSQGIDCMQPDRSGPFPASMPTQSIAVRGKSN